MAPILCREAFLGKGPGRFVGSWENYDVVGAMQQVGAISPPEQGES
jgi:hypothetical protein